MRPLLLFVVLLSACAHSPQDVRESGERAERRSQQSAQNAALCIVRNAEAMSFGIAMRAMVTMRPAVSPPGAHEVLVYGSEIHGTIAMASVVPDGERSRITTWRARTWLLGSGQLERMADGC